MRPHIPAVMPLLMDIVLQRTDPQPTVSLLENACITIGRLGLACPDTVARYLPDVFVSLYVANRGPHEFGSTNLIVRRS